MNMLKLAYSEGIRTIITTPHFVEGRVTGLIQRQQECLSELKHKLETTLPDMKLFTGGEIYYSHDSVKLLNEKLIPTMANSKYVLIEFSPMAEYRYIKNGLQQFIFEGYTPILAHVERYTNVNIDCVYELIDIGVYIQINAMSISGETGRTYLSITKKLLKNNLVHFIATDCHSDNHRSPKLKKAIDYIKKKYGESYVNELLIDNPTKILNNQYIT
jgi:protein-tyrosine phosphatase